MDRFAQMIVAAARQAQADAGLEIEQECDRVGVSVATAMGGLKSFENACDTLDRAGPRAGQPLRDPHDHSEYRRRPSLDRTRHEGPALLPVHRLRRLDDGDRRRPRRDPPRSRRRHARRWQRGGDHEGRYRRLLRLRALSQRNDDPEHASRPFDADRDGFVMGEAGAVLVLEELGHATRRGARIYAELVGYGVSSDAQHLTEPDPTGQSPARAMLMAFADAGISPDQIDYINAHGTSTPLGDASETRVIKRALGEHIARKVPISSTKGATGHCLGAAGAVEAIFCTLAIHEGVLPPTINYETPDPECDLDYVPNEAREADVGVAVSNSSGFGGHNASIVLRRFAG